MECAPLNRTCATLLVVNRSIDVAARELRNHTTRVLDEIEAGVTVYLTRHGKRIARIEPLAPRSWGEQTLDYLDRFEPYDSGLAQLLAEDDQASMDEPG